MKFSDVIRNLKINSTNVNSFDFYFNRLTSNSEKTTLGDVFICKRGTLRDGHDYIKAAVEKGAKTVVAERVTDYLKDNPSVRYITVSDTNEAEAIMLNSYFDAPTKGMKLIAVTGTNGKTSTSYMLRAILKSAGYKVGLIGTVKNYIENTDITNADEVTHFNSMTTPSQCELYEIFAKMKSQGVNTVVLEASSHALAQKRLDSFKFDLGIFTNLTEDHLDYHKTIAEYRNAKAHLFTLCSKALINTDCENGRLIFDTCKCEKFSYSQNRDSDFKALNVKTSGSSVSYTAVCFDEKIDVLCPIPGEFTVYNSLAAISAACILGVDKSISVQALQKLEQIPGRLEKIYSPHDVNIYIDYAHTPDALEKVLKTLKSSFSGKLITVFGCGGNREREKRPIMGRIATNISDYTIITEDNSRNEKSDDIINDIVAGVGVGAYKVIKNRRNAIFHALDTARRGDTVLLAGKGHEDYEIIGNTKKHFSEKEIIKEYYSKNIKQP